MEQVIIYQVDVTLKKGNVTSLYDVLGVEESENYLIINFRDGSKKYIAHNEIFYFDMFRDEQQFE